MFDFYAGLQGAIADKQIHIPATSDEKRNPLLQGVPTAKESGLPDYVVTSWNGLSSPPACPTTAENLNREIVAALADPELQEKASAVRHRMRAAPRPSKCATAWRATSSNGRGVIEKAGIAKQ